MVVPRFIESALKNEPIRIYGTGKQSRCFCYVEDVVDAVIRLMNCSNAMGEVFNIGSDDAGNRGRQYNCHANAMEN